MNDVYKTPSVNCKLGDATRHRAQFRMALLCSLVSVNSLCFGLSNKHFYFPSVADISGEGVSIPIFLPNHFLWSHNLRPARMLRLFVTQAGNTWCLRSLSRALILRQVSLSREASTVVWRVGLRSCVDWRIWGEMSTFLVFSFGLNTILWWGARIYSM